MTPIVLTGSKIAKACQILSYSFFSFNCLIKIESASCKILIFTFVISPGILTANPGPGKGCLFKIESGTFNFFPRILTSSLKSSFKGSINLKFNFFGSPPTLWCDLIFAEGAPLTDIDSITSGYKVPCAKYFIDLYFFDSLVKISINNFPIIFLFFSGLITFFNLLRNKLPALIL